jgi:hypothetical protein
VIEITNGKPWQKYSQNSVLGRRAECHSQVAEFLLHKYNGDLSSNEIARLNGVERASAGGKKRRAIMSSSHATLMFRGIISIHGAHETTDS